MGSGSRKKKANRRKKAHKPNQCNTACNHPISDEKKELDMCNETEGSNAEKIDEKSNALMSEIIHIPQQQNQSDRDEAEEENELVDPSSPTEKNNELVDDSPSQSVASVPETVRNDESADSSPPQIPFSAIEVTLDIPEPKGVGTGSHNSEINNSCEQEGDVLSIKSTEIAIDENNGNILEEMNTLGTTTDNEQGISLSSPRPELSVTNSVEPETGEIDPSSEIDEQVDASALTMNPVEINNNGRCCCTPSPSHTASVFLEPEQIKEMDHTSLFHHRNPFDPKAMVLKPGHDHDQASYRPNLKIDKVSNSNGCCIGEVLSELDHEVGDIPKEIPREHSNNCKNRDVVPSQLSPHLQGNRDVGLNMNGIHQSVEDVKSSESSSSPSSKKHQSKGGREEEDESDGAEQFAEFQNEQVDMKMEKASWRSCCGLFSLSIR